MGSVLTANAFSGDLPSNSKQDRPKASKTKPPKPNQSPQANAGQAAEQALPTPAPSDPAQIVEEKMKRDKADPPSYQGQVSKRLDEYYGGSSDK